MAVTVDGRDFKLSGKNSMFLRKLPICFTFHATKVLIYLCDN